LKTLYLLRHAKADSGLLNDLARDLSAKGRRQTASMGQWMSATGIIPERIISSSAKRTKLIAKICSELIGYQRSLRFEDNLYDARSESYLDVIAVLNNRYDSVMIVGHNPAISTMVTILTGVRLDMSPCMLVCIGFTFDNWISIN